MSSLCDTVMPYEKLFVMGIDTGPMYAAQDKCWGGSMAYAVQAAVEFADKKVRKLLKNKKLYPDSLDIFLEDWGSAFSEKFKSKKVIKAMEPESFWDSKLVVGLLDEAFTEVMAHAAFDSEEKSKAFTDAWAAIVKK